MKIIGIDIRNIGKKRTGDEAVFFNLVKCLRMMDSRERADKIFYLFTDILDKNKIEEIEKKLGIEDRKDFKVISLKTKNRFTWNLWSLPKYLRKNRVDVYLTQYITPWFVPKKIYPRFKAGGFFSFIEKKYFDWRIRHFGAGVKIVTIVHDISFNFFPQFIGKSDLFFLKTLIPLSMKRADKIIAVSRFTKNEVAEYYRLNPEKIEWIHNAVGENFANRTLDAKIAEQVRKKYNLPEKFLFSIGTMQPRKNIPLLVKAYGGIKNKIPEIKLVLAGGTGTRNFDSRIKETIAKEKLEKDVFFPGYIEEKDKPVIFQMACVFVFPSLYEGFGIPILEAFASGVPALVSDIPSFREVAEDGAMFFDPGSLADFTEKLYTVSVDEKIRKKMIESGKTRLLSFSWEKSARKVFNVCNNL